MGGRALPSSTGAVATPGRDGSVLGVEYRHEVEVESFPRVSSKGGWGEVGGKEYPLPGDSGEHRGHGIPDLRDDSEELKDEATAHNEGQDHWRFLGQLGGSTWNNELARHIPTQLVEMGDLFCCLGLETDGPFPRLAASFFANLSFARRC